MPCCGGALRDRVSLRRSSAGQCLVLAFHGMAMLRYAAVTLSAVSRSYGIIRSCFVRSCGGVASPGGLKLSCGHASQSKTRRRQGKTKQCKARLRPSGAKLGCGLVKHSRVESRFSLAKQSRVKAKQSRAKHSYGFATHSDTGRGFGKVTCSKVLRRFGQVL